jgi:hypothetical protein
VTVIAGYAVPGVTGNTLVRIIHRILIMGMTIDTTKYLIVVWIGMAIRAKSPFTLMVS